MSGRMAREIYDSETFYSDPSDTYIASQPVRFVLPAAQV